MDRSGVTQSCAEGAGPSSRRIRDEAFEKSVQSDPLGGPPHVESRERVSTKVRGTKSKKGGDESGLPFPLPL